MFAYVPENYKIKVINIKIFIANEKFIKKLYNSEKIINIIKTFNLVI